MSSYETMLEGLTAISKGVEEAQEKFSRLGGKPSEHVRELIDGLFSFARFKEGDRVVLSKTPVITEEQSPGWRGSKHFLKKGAKGWVTNRDWRADLKSFVYGIQFDDESWIHPYTKKIEPIEQQHKHSFCFRESFISPCNEQKDWEV